MPGMQDLLMRTRNGIERLRVDDEIGVDETYGPAVTSEGFAIVAVDETEARSMGLDPEELAREIRDLIRARVKESQP